MISDPSEVRGFTKPAAGEYLRAMASSLPPALCAVELGVYFGRSLMYLAQGCAESGTHVYGFDPYDLPGDARYPFAWQKEKAHRSLFMLAETRESAEFTVANNPWAAHVTLTREFSENAGNSWTGPKVGLWHCDGNHEYDHVIGDFTAWQPHFVPSAVLCFDDYTKNCPDVIRAVDDLHEQGLITKPKLAPGCRRLVTVRYTPKGVTH